jgi:hypothetical protein
MQNFNNKHLKLLRLIISRKKSLIIAKKPRLTSATLQTEFNLSSPRFKANLCGPSNSIFTQLTLFYIQTNKFHLNGKSGEGKQMDAFRARKWIASVAFMTFLYGE